MLGDEMLLQEGALRAHNLLTPLLSLRDKPPALYQVGRRFGSHLCACPTAKQPNSEPPLWWCCLCLCLTIQTALVTKHGRSHAIYQPPAGSTSVAAASPLQALAALHVALSAVQDIASGSIQGQAQQRQLAARTAASVTYSLLTLGSTPGGACEGLKEPETMQSIAKLDCALLAACKPGAGASAALAACQPCGGGTAGPKEGADGSAELGAVQDALLALPGGPGMAGQALQDR
jgi:hypothetical protein